MLFDTVMIAVIGFILALLMTFLSVDKEGKRQYVLVLFLSLFVTFPQIMLIVNQPAFLIGDHPMYELFLWDYDGFGFLLLKSPFYLLISMVVGGFAGFVLSASLDDLAERRCFKEFKGLVLPESVANYKLLFVAWTFAVLSTLISFGVAVDHVKYSLNVPVVTHGMTGSDEDKVIGNLALMDKYCPDGVVVTKLEYIVNRDLGNEEYRGEVLVDLICNVGNRKALKYTDLSSKIDKLMAVEGSESNELERKLILRHLKGQLYTQLIPEYKDKRQSVVVEMMFEGRYVPDEKFGDMVDSWGYLIPLIGAMIDKRVKTQDYDVSGNRNDWLLSKKK